MFLYLCLLVSLLSASIVQAENITLWIGAPLTLSGRWQQFGKDGEYNIQLWSEYVDSMGGIVINDGADRVFPRFVIRDVGAPTVAEMVQLTQSTIDEMLNGTASTPPIDIALAPYTSTLTEVVALRTNPKGILTLAHAASADSLYMCDESNLLHPCTRPNTRRFSNLFSTLALSSDAFRTVISLANTKEAQSVGVIYEDQAFTAMAAQGALDEATKNKMDVPMFEKIATCDEVDSGENDACARAMEGVVQRLKDADPDFVMAPTYPDLCIRFVQAMKKLNYMPKAVALDVCIGHLPTVETLGEDFRYFTGVQQWNRHLTGELYTEDTYSAIGMYTVRDAAHDKPSAVQYAEDFHRVANAYPSYQSASYMACLQTIHMAVAISGSIDQMKMHDAITYSWQNSFYGQLAFNRIGTSTKQFVTTQNDDTVPAVELEIVTPLDSATGPFIYPMPSWDERTYNPRLWATGTEQAVLFATLFGILIICLEAGAVFRYRNATVMKAASPQLLLTSLVGAQLLLMSNFVWSLHTSDLQCRLRPILLAFGFSLLFSPLFVKTFRLSLIFMSTDLSRIQVPTRQIVLFVSVPVLFDSILLLVWYIVDLPSATVDIDRLRPAHSIALCTSQPAFTWIMVACKVVFASLGALLMFRSRKIPVFFNETQSIGASIACVLFCSVFLVPISAIDTMPRELQFSLRSFGLLIGVLATTALLLFHKFALIHDLGIAFRPDDMQKPAMPMTRDFREQEETQQAHMMMAKACNVCGELQYFPASPESGISNKVFFPTTGTGPSFAPTPSPHHYRL